MLSDLLVSGALQHVNSSLVEFHVDDAGSKERRHRLRLLRAAVIALKKAVPAKINVKSADDEMFNTADFQLPQCQN